MSTIEWPTREQVRSTLDHALDDEALTDGWRRVLAGLNTDLEHLIGLTSCMQLLHENHDSLAGEVEPGAHDRPPGIHMGVYYAHQAVAARWRECVYHYARRAQAALQAVAEGITPEFGRPLPGERESSGVAESAEPTAPDVDIPAGLDDRDDLSLLRFGLAQLAEAEQAAEEEWEMGEYEDEETGEVRHCIPEHQIEASQELLAEAARWDEYLADYADAVTYTLVTTLREHLHQSAPATV